MPHPHLSRTPLARLVAFCIAPLLAAPAFAQLPLIDEIVVNHVGIDTDEMIEVWGPMATSLATYTVLVIDSDTNPGEILNALPVGTTNGSGIWTSSALADESLSNQSVTVLLVENFSGAVGNDLDPGNDGTFDTTPWTVLRDSVALSDDTGVDVFYSTVVVGPGFDGNAAVPGGISRLPSGVDTNAVSDWTRNDFDGAGLLNMSDTTLDAGEAWNTPAFVNRQREADYWNGVSGGNAAALRAAIHAKIDDHQTHAYSSDATDTWDILEEADEDPANSNNIVALYLNASVAKFGGGTGPYNREHTWPQSYGFPSGNTNTPRTDCHHLFLDDVDTNNTRGSRPFGTCASGCSADPTVTTNGVGGMGGTYPNDDNNWYKDPSSGPTGIYEVWNHRKGDVARAQLYMDVRYEGGTHTATGASELNLILTDNTALIASTSASPAYMGRLATLLQWHANDPVTEGERRRNDVVWRYQGNRNPFVDHPEWVTCVWAGVCGAPDTTAPTGPTIQTASPAPSTWSNDATVNVTWSGASDEPGGSGLAGYSVLFDQTATTVPDTSTEVSQSSDPHGTTSTTLPNGNNNWFHVRACDAAGNCSADTPTMHHGPFWIDTAAPTPAGGFDSPSHDVNVSSTDPSVDLVWTAAADPVDRSGLAGYSLTFDQSAANVCTQTLNLGDTALAATRSATLNGSWYAHICARDHAGNWTAATTLGPFVITGAPWPLLVDGFENGDLGSWDGSTP